jgi:transcriptional regulator with XRE-family HTH domain
MATVGQELKRERELRGISLKEIADSTKINMRFLRALENDQMDFLPGEFFTKGIIRTYADYIGLESDKILDSYYETARMEEAGEGEEKETEAETETEAKNRKIIQSTAWIIFIFAVMLVIYLFFKDRLFPPQDQQVIIPSVTEIYPSAPPDLLTQAEAEGIHLDILFEELTWIRLYADGELILDGLQPAGKQTTVHASELIRIDTGNAGGITHFINGHAGKSLGESGEVVSNIRLTPDNLKKFLKDKKR